MATSPDLTTWTRDPGWQVLEADDQYYEKHGDSDWFDEAWRDPWVYPDSAGNGWHMLVTAQARTGGLRHRGVVGHATSPDLATWTVQPPLSTPDAGFGQLEVLQLVEVDGRWALIFSCLQAELSGERRLADPGGGIWTVPVETPTGPFNLSRATRLTGPELYAGRLVQDRTGQWNLMAFHNIGDNGRFIGALSEPIPVAWDGARLAVAVEALTT